jgi:hypothetical protein
LRIDNNLLINSDKRLFLVPLKYYVKYFSLKKCPSFDSVILKYKSLCKISPNLMNNKILILEDKLKLEKGLLGTNDLLLTKIKNFGEKSCENNKEGFLLYTDFYLDRLLSDEIIFNYYFTKNVFIIN